MCGYWGGGICREKGRGGWKRSELQLEGSDSRVLTLITLSLDNAWNTKRNVKVYFSFLGWKVYCDDHVDILLWDVVMVGSVWTCLRGPPWSELPGLTKFQCSMFGSIWTSSKPIPPLPSAEKGTISPAGAETKRKRATLSWNYCGRRKLKALQIGINIC